MPVREPNIPELASLREYLSRHFPGQRLTARELTTGKIAIDVRDSKGHPKELRFYPDIFTGNSQEALEGYLRTSNIAEQLQSALYAVDLLRTGTGYVTNFRSE